MALSFYGICLKISQNFGKKLKTISMKGGERLNTKEYETILVKKEEGIATITLNRPEQGNAFTLTMFRELRHAIEDTAQDDTVRVVILTGAGRMFCSGGDLKDNPVLSLKHPAKQRARFREEIHKTYLSLIELEKPTIAAVNGTAVTAGCDLALLCDIRIASEKARFGESYVNIGVMPDSGGTWLLPRLVGISKACELIFTGDIIDAREAERIGLVSKVVPAEELEREAKALAAKIAKGPPIALGLSKSAIYKGLTMDFATALESVACGISICLQSEDFQEGIKAFSEKRKPQFKVNNLRPG